MRKKLPMHLERLANALDKVRQRKQERIEARKYGMTEPAIESYKDAFKLSRRDFNGLVLDVGAAYGLPESWKNARIICLDPAYAGKFRAMAAWKPKRRVAGIVQELPFKDKSFETTIACFSSPYYESAHLPAEAMQGILEMIRVTKRKVGIFPFDCLSKEMQKKITCGLRKAVFGFNVFQPKIKGHKVQSLLVYPQKRSNFQLLKKLLMQ